jgi:WD40 repeat protein
MPAAPPTLRLFVSSPGDVGQERLLAERVLTRLQGRFAARAQIEPILWEHEPLRATGHFQSQIRPPSETDIVVFILWARLGTRLPEQFDRADGTSYASGTEWEFEDAVEAHRAGGTPDLLVYRKTKTPQAALDDEDELAERLRQKKALDAFLDRWFGSGGEEGFKAAFHTFETPDAFERLLETHLAKLIAERLPEQATAAAAGEGASAAQAVRWHAGSPYRGLEPFRHEHAPVFFGRTRAVGEITAALEAQARAASAFVLVFGASGSGKSSVVRAGVGPTVTRPGVVEGIGLWRRATVRPSDAPEGDLVAGLAAALLQDTALPGIADTGFGADELAELLREAPKGAAAPIRAALRQEAKAVAEAEGLPTPPEARLLVTLDQLEEMFSLGEVTEAGRAAFAEAVEALAASGAVWIVGTMRSDFFARCAEVEALMRLKKDTGQYHLEAPSFAEIGQMIRYPAEAAGLRFERDPERGVSLDEVLHEAAAASPEALPLLSFTLAELYRRRTEAGVMTFAAYEALGELEGALARRAEEVYGELPPAVQAELPGLVRQIATLERGDAGGDGAAGEAVVSRRVALSSVTRTPEAERLTRALVEARLLVTSGDEGEATVGVAHEALLRRWPRAAQQIERDRAFLQARRRVAEAEARWRAAGKPEDLLLPEGLPLTEGEEMVAERGADLSARLRRYVAVSTERAEAERTRRRRRAIGAVAAVFLALAVGLGAALWQARVSAEQRDEALRAQSLSLAEKARAATTEGDAMTGMLLALEALPEDVASPDRPFVPEAQAALYDALMQNREAGRITGLPERLYEAAQVSPQGQYVTAPLDSGRTVGVYEMPSLSVVTTLGEHTGTVAQVQFHPEGPMVATASHDSTARLWLLPSGDVLHTFRHEEPIYGAEFGQNGSVLMTGSNQSVKIWDVETGALLASRKPGGGKRFRSLWAHPITSEVIIEERYGEKRGYAGVVYLWDWDSGREILLSDRGQGLTGLAFSPDGQHLATCVRFLNSNSTTGNDEITTWQLGADEPEVLHRGSPDGIDQVLQVEFNHDGGSLLVRSVRKAFIMDATTGERTASLSRDLGRVYDARYVNKGRDVATVIESDDKNVIRIHDDSTLNVLERVGFTKANYTAMLRASRDGEGLVSTLRERADLGLRYAGKTTMTSWRLTTDESSTIPLTEGATSRTLLSPNGSTLAFTTSEYLITFNVETNTFSRHQPCGEGDGLHVRGLTGNRRYHPKTHFASDNLLIVPCSSTDVVAYDLNTSSGRRMVTTSASRAADARAELLRVLPLGNGSRVLTSATSESKRSVASVRLWRLPEAELIRESTASIEFGEDFDTWYENTAPSDLKTGYYSFFNTFNTRLWADVDVSENGKFYMETFKQYGPSGDLLQGAPGEAVVRAADTGDVTGRVASRSSAVDSTANDYPIHTELGCSGACVLVLETYERIGADAERVVDVASGRTLRRLKDTPPSLQLQGDLVAQISSNNDTVFVQVLATGDTLHAFSHEARLDMGSEHLDIRYLPFPPLFSPDAHYLLAKSQSGRYAYVWDLRDESVIALRAGGPSKYGVRFGPPSTSLVLLQPGGNLSGGVYDYTTGALHAWPRAPDWQRVHFTPDGSFLITHDGQGTIRRWPLFASPQALIDSARAAVTRQLTPEQRQRAFLAPVER